MKTIEEHTKQVNRLEEETERVLRLIADTIRRADEVLDKLDAEVEQKNGEE